MLGNSDVKKTSYMADELTELIKILIVLFNVILLLLSAMHTVTKNIASFIKELSFQSITLHINFSQIEYFD